MSDPLVTLASEESAAAEVPASAPVKKPTGRPCLGGNDTAIWTSLRDKCLGAQPHKTKNGLPGVPYEIKNLITDVKTVWSTYTPDVETGSSPSEWSWIATKRAAIIESLLHHPHLKCDDVYRLLSSLLRVVTVLTRDDPSNFPSEVGTEYAEALDLIKTSMDLHTMSPAEIFHHVTYADWIRIRDHVVTAWKLARDSLKNADISTPSSASKPPKTASPEMARNLSWAGLALWLLVPDADSSRAPLVPRDGSSIFLDALTYVTYEKGMEDITTTKPLLFCSIDAEHKDWYVRIPNKPEPLAFKGLDQTLVDMLIYAVKGLDFNTRVFPKRLTVTTLFQRLSRSSVLKKTLDGIVLNVKDLEIAWVTHVFHDTLPAVLEKAKSVGLDDVTSIFPFVRSPSAAATTTGKRLRFPDDPVDAASLVVPKKPRKAKSTKEAATETEAVAPAPAPAAEEGMAASPSKD